MSLWSQNTVVTSIRIGTNPNGARFYVDGQLYYAQQTFLWPVGSKHIVSFPLFVAANGVATGFQLSLDNNVQYAFGGWVDNTGNLAPGNSPDQTVTADPAVTSLIASVTPNYRVDALYSNFPTGPVGCGAPGNPPQDGPRPGIIYVNGTCFGSNLRVYIPAGQVRINAFPYPGYVFTGWSVNGQTLPAYLTTFNVVGPMTVYAIFQQAKRAKFATIPTGLNILVDHTQVPTSSQQIVDGIAVPPNNICTPDPGSLPPNAPSTLLPLCLGEFDFLPNSSHTLAAETQPDKSGKYWVPSSWSVGSGGPQVTYVASGALNVEDFAYLTFVPGVQSSFLTSPTGLKLLIDGRDNWPAYNFIWGSGTTHTISAPGNQVVNGRKYNFQGWSNGGAATQTFNSDATGGPLRLIATYSVVPQAVITSVPTGLTFQVDGNNCTTPCAVDRPSGTQIQISAPQSIPNGDSARLDLVSWSDGATLGARPFTLTGDTQTIVATYQTSWRLSASSDPAGAATYVFSPASNDMFYPAGTQVNVTVTPNAGYSFRRWGGDLSGTYPQGSLLMSSGHLIVALFDKVPYIKPAGIKNAAGDTPVTTVGPGSIISIFGDGLCPSLVVASTNPLPQSLGNISVRVNDRILPLLFVSPSQINAILPSDLPDGDYVLRVTSATQPDLTGNFSIARDSPGILLRPIDGDSRPLALVTHTDGSAVTFTSPAAQGETVAIFGTGFGPYQPPVFDGFTVPDFSHPTADPVTVTVGSTQLQPVFAGAAPGFVGLTMTQVVITNDIQPASVQNLKVTVNGVDSNTAVLPIK